MEKRCWILVVEDDPDFREFLKSELERSFGKQVHVQVASDGSDATTKVSNQKYDCILTDWDMPKRNGEGFLKIVREREFNKNTPVFVITGNENPQIDFKKVAVLPKPLHSELLIETMSKLLNLKKLVTES